MKIDDIIDDINIFIANTIKKKYNVKNDFITDDNFRCISINILDGQMDYLKYDEFKSNLYKNFNLYISDFIDIEEGKTFNIYIYSDEYFRIKKLNKLTNNIYNNGI